MNMSHNSRHLRIWQQNVAKSSVAQHDVLAKANPKDWDIIALQEPYLDFLGLTRANSHWNVIYPSNKNRENQKRIRTIILISTNIDSSQIQQVNIQSSDITAVHIKTHTRSLLLFNVYIDNTNNHTIETIANEWELHEQVWSANPATEILLLGDFNRHHSTWEAQHNAHLTSPDRLLNPLLDLIVNMRLEMALPRNIPTLEARNTGNWTRPDNVWRCSDSPSPFISCNVKPELRPAITDHLPIISVIDLTYAQSQQPARFNYKAVDWDAYNNRLDTEIKDSAAALTTPIDSIAKLEQATDQLFEAIDKTTREVASPIKLTPHTKRWWTKDLSTLRISRNRASAEHYKWRGLPDHPSHAEYRKLNADFVRAIEHAKASHWKEWIEHASGEDVWTIHKYMKANPTDYGKQRIPDLKLPDGTTASSNETKAKGLAITFFPPERPLNWDEHTFEEQDPPEAQQSKFPAFSPERVANTLSKVNPHKAPGPSGISNAILKQCATSLAPYLSAIYSAICKFKHMPTKLRSIHQVVLPKPGRASYEIPNSYRPIALIETIAKVLSTIITEDLSFECETNNLLPGLQFGGRPGRSTTDALHYAEQYIKNAWRKGNVVAALFLDIQAAFPNMRKDKLIENMRARNLAPEYCDYVEMILTQRQIHLKFDDHISAPFSPDNGCCQGCPLSMLLYAIYNAPLIRIADPNNSNECIIGYVDDTTLLASGKDTKEAHETLKSMMERANGVFDWSKSFNSPLEMNKLTLVNFTMSSEKADNDKKLVLNYTHGGVQNTVQVQPSPNAKLLGVILDSKLNWAAHHEKVREKAVKWTMAFKRFTRTASGMKMNEARKLYNAVAVPKITYAADLWFRPQKVSRANRNPAGFGPALLTKRLESIQRQAAISITGGLRTSPGDALIVHANLVPIGAQLKEACLKTYARLASRPTDHPITHAMHRTAKYQVKQHRTALHHLAKSSNYIPSKVEKIGPTRLRPGEQPDFETLIAISKEAAIADDQADFGKGKRIYTDGSGYEGQVGASAVMFINGRKTAALRYRLGPLMEHTVFEGELVGIILGFHLARSINGTRNRISFSIDNQATIKTLDGNDPQPAQYLIDKIKEDISSFHAEETAKRERLNIINPQKSEIIFTWVAGHMGSVGNEAADELAKYAAIHGSSGKNRLPTCLRRGLPISLSAIKQKISDITKCDTKEWWKRSKRYRRIKSIDPSLPSGKYIKATADLNRKQTSILTQLRIDHIPLNNHLFRIKKAASPYCAYCPNTTETTNHFLFFCQKFARQRHKLVLALKRKAFSKNYILTDESAIRHTINYINDTGRFKHYIGDIKADLIQG